VDRFTTDANAWHDDSLMNSVAQLLSQVSLFLFVWIPFVSADGGKVEFQRIAGPFVITLFTDAPIYLGTGDISVMIQDRNTRDSVLDARVGFTFRSEDGTIVEAKATREQAQNKLLYAASVAFPESGRWQVEIDVSRGMDATLTTGEITIVPSESRLSSYWGYFLIPPLGIILFVLHQWLKVRQST
jgi:hypothetical protein